jgi:hypothetical protein
MATTQLTSNFHRFNGDGTVSIFFSIPRIFDIVKTITSLKIILEDEKDIDVNEFYLTIYDGVARLKKYNINDNISLPSYCLPFTKVCIEIILPKSYSFSIRDRVNICQVSFINEIATSPNVEKWENYDIKNGTLQVELPKIDVTNHYVFTGNFALPRHYGIYDITPSNVSVYIEDKRIETDITKYNKDNLLTCDDAFREYFLHISDSSYKSVKFSMKNKVSCK